MYKKKKIYCNIYNVHIHIVYTDNIKKMCNEYNTEMHQGMLDNSHVVLTYQDPNPLVVIFLNESKKLHPSDIAHEGLHAANSIMNYINYRFDPENDEPLAYLLSWIVEEIYKFLNQIKIVV